MTASTIIDSDCALAPGPERQLRLFEQLVSSTPDFVYAFDLEGRFVYANRRLLQVWGMKISDIVGKTCLELGYQKWHHDMHMREIAQVIATRQPIKGEVPFKAPLTGVFGVYEYIFNPVFGPDDNVELITGTTRDVTDRKRAEEALRVREQRYHELFNSMTEGFCLLEPVSDDSGRVVDFRHIEVNPALLAQSGFNDVLGKTIRDLIPDEADEWIETYNDVATTGQSARFEREVVATQRILEVHAYRAGSPNSRSVGVVFRDISQRKRAQEQLLRNHDTFYHLIQNNPFGIYVIDSQFRLRQVSRGAEKVFSKTTPTIGRDFAEILRCIWDEPFATQAIKIFRHTLDTGEPYESPRTVERRHDIQEIEAYDWRIERITLPDGRFGVVCYFYDLSEREKWEAAMRANLETQVAERTAKLRETIVELEALSYSISHDMRAPLRAMQGFSTALLDDYKDRLDYTGVSYLERISAASRRLDSLIQDILLYTSVGRERLTLKPVALDPLVDEVLHTYHPNELNFVTVKGPLPAVLAHEAFLSQILSNLITNALKFVAKGVTPKVIIRSEVADNLVRLWIEDNGVGIAPQHLKSIFQVFGRVYSAAEYPGTGIGLAIVKRAVLRLGGDVGVESEINKGSRFWITLQRPK